MHAPRRLRARGALRVALPARSVRARASSVAAPAAPLTKQDLVDYLKKGCKPRSAWRIGTEHEKLAVKGSNGKRADYADIQHVLERLVSRFGWEAMFEDGNIIGCKLNGQSVTLEPGGQFELSGAPLANLHQTCDEVNSHLYQAKAISEEVGVRFVGLGFDPSQRYEDVPMMPKNRYNIMRDYMPQVGTLGRDMMFRSCTIQVNIDFEDEQDMIEKFRVGLALQPIATALFANSPFKEGAPTGYQSWRSHVWSDVDNNRCGDLPFVFEDDFSFERYVDYAMDVPMYFAYRDGAYHDVTGESFRDFLTGDLKGCPGEVATLDDWEAHLTTIFPEVRLKRYMEMRGADGGPWGSICALPAFWIGLLYDAPTQQKCVDLVADWTREERAHLRAEVPKTGLQTPFRDGTVQDVAREVVALAKAGLQARGLDEAKFVERLEGIAESGESLSGQMLRKYESEWGNSVLPAYDYMQF